MHVETAPQAANGNEKFRKIRVLAQKLRELVNNNDQGGQWPVLAYCSGGSVVLADVGEVSGGAQQLLAAVHLTGDGIVHALYQRRFLFQVSNHCRGMRQVVTS